MRRRLLIPLLLAAALIGAGAARGEIFQSGDLRVRFDGGFTPRALPRDRPAPIVVRVEGRIETTDGGRPPALRRFEVDLNRNGRLTRRGLPSCDAALLQSTSTAAALQRCPGARVGGGSFSADVDLGQPVPARGRIVVFNARQGRRPALLLHLYVSTPVQATLVLPLTISHRRGGRFGTVLATEVPRLAGGLGSITQIELRIGRTYRYRGRSLSYLSASCAAPSGFGLAVFPFAKGSFTFAGGRNLRIALTRDCRVR